MTAPSRAILLTAPGPAAIAVIRIAGPLVAPFLSRHFSKPAVPGRCVHGILSDEGHVVDDPVVVLQEAGTVDLNLHGGPWILRSTLDLLSRAGFEISDTTPNSPLPVAAVDAISTVETEVLTHLPLARTELAVRTLLAQPVAWEHLMSHPDPAVLRRALHDRGLHWLLHPPRVAIIGPANVGKSTLANQLFAQERSIVADLPGTTRDWVGELANVNGLAVTLVDTPGLRDSTDPIEQAAIQRSTDIVTGADLILLVLDATRPLDGEQSALLSRNPTAIVVLNKTDLADIPSHGALRISARTAQGVDAVRQRICHHFGCADLDPAAPRCWTPRQRQFLQQMFAAHSPT